MVNTIYLLSFVETPRKFIIAELSIHKLGSSSVLSIIDTDEDPSLRIESSAIINLRGVSTRFNKYKYTVLLHAGSVQISSAGLLPTRFFLYFHIELLLSKKVKFQIHL